MQNLLPSLALILFDKSLDWVHEFIVYSTQRACEAKCAAVAAKAGAIGFKTGLLYGFGGAIVLVLVIGGIVFLVFHFKNQPVKIKLAYL